MNKILVTGGTTFVSKYVADWHRYAIIAIKTITRRNEVMMEWRITL